MKSLYISNKLMVCAFCFIVSNSSFAYTQCTGRYYDCQKLKEQEGVKIDGTVQGQIREVGNTTYIRNVKITQTNSDKPALQVVTLEGSKKRVVVDNVQVNVRNADVSTNYGLASSVGFHLQNEGNSITNLTVNSSGVNRYNATSSSQQNAAGVQVEQYKGRASHKINSSKNTLNSHGVEIIHSTQNLP